MTSQLTSHSSAGAGGDTGTSPTGCGCPDYQRSGLTRRTILRTAGALGVASALSGIAGVRPQTAYAAPNVTGTGASDVLVVISLRGGFDGLSAVAPVSDPDYLKARPTIGIPASRALQLDSRFGMHPALKPLQRWYASGQFAVVHAVGQVNPTRSHFAAMEDLERAAPGSSLRTGWIDRMIGVTGSSSPFTATALTPTAPVAFSGPSPDLTMPSLADFTLSGAGNATERDRWTKALRTLYAGQPATLAAPATATLDAVSRAAALAEAGYQPEGGARYPDGELGHALADVAHLVKARTGIRVATLDVGDWDMHVDLGRSDSGWMFRKLTELGQALDAFATDLGSELANVTVVTLSEFGRRVAENGSGGLDHGHGNAVLVLGGGVVGGRVHGTWPGLSPTALDTGDLPGATDYRTILAEILEKRCGVAVGTVFPRLGTARLGLVRSR